MRSTPRSGTRSARRSPTTSTTRTSGSVSRERRAFVVLGPPGAGKSKVVADRAVAEHGALEIDSDVAKESLPEFMDGINAQGVHAESARIVEDIVTPRAIAAGDNIVLPRVGGKGRSVAKLLDQLQEAGYTVELSLVDLD